MYHLALNNFPHNCNRFNMNERELLEIVVPYTRGQEISLGEQTWDAKDTTLIVMEGRELAVGELAPGRGWGIVERTARDVTVEVLARVAADSAPKPASGEFADVLGGDGARLLEEWRTVVNRSPELQPSEALALAELALRTRGAK